MYVRAAGGAGPRGERQGQRSRRGAVKIVTHFFLIWAGGLAALEEVNWATATRRRDRRRKGREEEIGNKKTKKNTTQTSVPPHPSRRLLLQNTSCSHLCLLILLVDFFLWIPSFLPIIALEAVA
jgi:hypothetical protein